MRPSARVGVLLCMLCTAATAEVANLEQFLRDCEAAAHVVVPLRGDGTLEVAGPNGTTRRPAVVIVRPPHDLYVELRDPTLKAVLPNQGAAYQVTAGSAKATAFAPEAMLADSDFARVDLDPFQLSRYKGWRISDESGNEVTVMLFPAGPPYALEVITFDREKLLPVKTLYYRDTLNNLVKIRRDGNFVLLGRKWMPAAVTMETFTLHTHSTLTLQWAQSPDFPPELFDPQFLPRLFAAPTPGGTPTSSAR